MRIRSPIDLETIRHGPETCFICEFIRGVPEYRHVELARCQSAIAFMSKYPTMEGYVLVAPLEHREQVTGDFTESEYLAVQRFVYRISEAVRRTMRPERVYVLSLGSQEANAHVHWHIAPLPRGVPLDQQQYYALMHENGAIATTDAELVTLAERIKAAMP